jgi:thiol-disulfide isomerase/thioredoxin
MPALSGGSDMSEWSVVCLCADWCGVCKQYQAVFEGLAQRHGDASFHWVDIEDEADAIGDVDVDTFPTLLIAHGADVHYFGAMTPQPEVLSRTIGGFMTDPSPSGRVPREASDLWGRVQLVLVRSSSRSRK